MRPVGGAPRRADLFLAGQITGVEGYAESTAMGLAAALYTHDVLSGRKLTEFPAATAIGSLLRYLKEAEPSAFQPINVNLGIFPKLTPLPKKLSKPERCAMYAERSRNDMEEFMRGMP